MTRRNLYVSDFGNELPKWSWDKEEFCEIAGYSHDCIIKRNIMALSLEEFKRLTDMVDPAIDRLVYVKTGCGVSVDHGNVGSDCIDYDF